MKINVATSHPSAFVSSTFIDFKEERAAVANLLRLRGLNINALDVKPASNDSSRRQIVQGVRESDFVILLIGDRYGSIVPRMTSSKQKSVTWWEYQVARRSGKHVIPFFKECSGCNSLEHDSLSDPEYDLKRAQLKQFKQVIQETHTPQYFSTVSELVDKVDKALIPVYRFGIVDALEREKNLKERVALLERQLKDSLQNQVISHQVTQPKYQNELLAGLGDIPNRPTYEFPNKLLDLDATASSVGSSSGIIANALRGGLSDVKGGSSGIIANVLRGGLSDVKKNEFSFD